MSSLDIDSSLSKPDQAYSLIRSRIVSGAYLPGQRIVIDAIVRELKMSPMPVREAIRRLEAEGWLVYRRHHGATVSRTDMSAWASEMVALAVLEGYATALAAWRIEAADLDFMRGANADFKHALRAFDVLAVEENNLKFHRRIHERCPNPHLREQIQAYRSRLGALRAGAFGAATAGGPASAEEHEHLIDMLDKRTHPSEVEHFARLHVLNAIAWVEQHARATLRPHAGTADADGWADEAAASRHPPQLTHVLTPSGSDLGPAPLGGESSNGDGLPNGR